MSSQIPNLIENTLESEKSICISAIRRQPSWILYQIHCQGLWDDLFLSALSPLFDPEQNRDMKSLYNASNRAIYRFLKTCGYRKAKVYDPQTKKTKVLWQNPERNLQ
jgi:hypothetical protein